MSEAPESTTQTPFSATPDAAFLAAMLAENRALKEQVAQLKQRVEWFEKQFFGRTSEKRVFDLPQQLSLLGFSAEELEKLRSGEEEKQAIVYQRGKGQKQRLDDCVNDSGLRFGEDVPVKRIPVVPPELRGSKADQWEVIDTRFSFKIAQQAAIFVVLQYELPVLKRKGSRKMATTPMIPQVLDNSVADVSFLVGLLVDKFLYHLPLYRQHQRLANAGITLARSTLTNLVHRACSLLKPIVDAQLQNILRSHVLAMDETAIKAGRIPRGGGNPGKMKQGWFWPLYGDADEIVFTYSNSRGRQHIERTLQAQFSGILISDGYSAYASFVEKVQGITAAQCWVHTRRQYLKAEAVYPQLVEQILEGIAALYTLEAKIDEQSLSGEAKRQYRLTHSKPIVDRIFVWVRQQLDQLTLTPSDPLGKALAYTLKREDQLRVFLNDPDVPLDTNHLERGLRPIPMGRKNWLFCWTEVGAEHVGTIQSLITTCKLHDINPTVYLTDVLQRISIHPASAIEELTPRVWKTKFADKPLSSMLQASGYESDAH